MDKDREDAGHEYFSQLYGATSVEGEPQQTVFDKWRDRLLVNTYRKYSTSKLADSDVLDVGCGGGILAESMAQEGAQVTGLDMGKEPLEVARLHALETRTKLTYIQSTIEDHAADNPHAYDVVTCMAEHVGAHAVLAALGLVAA